MMSLFAGMNIKDWLAVIGSLFSFVVIPFTLIGIWRNRIISREAENWKARQDEIGTYNDINNKYSDFLKTLLSNTDVDIGEFDTPSVLTTDAAKYKRSLMYAMLVTLMERAYLLYTAVEAFEQKLAKNEENKKWLVVMMDRVEIKLFGPHPERFETHIFKTQWPNWQKYFEYYCSHKAFQDYWRSTVSTETPGPATQWHDSEFERFVNELIAKETGTIHNALVYPIESNA